jgi:DNA uptake protein ComE-like DNA-binding protein
LGALAFSALMVSEREVVHMTGRQIQATALAESGIEMARLFLSEQPDVQFSDGTWHEDLERFQGVLVLDDGTPHGRGRFAIIAPVDDQSSGGARFGLECESSKLNLNTLLESSEGAQAQRDRLMSLPGMSEEIADGILDWLDADDEAREFGAEAEYYESLAPSYRPTNGPIRCLEELLFVRGITSELLFGSDRNRNGKLDADESDAAATAETNSANGIGQRGWSAYLTLFSREKVAQPDGSPKIDLNRDDAQQLYAELEEAFGSEWATFIVGYRQQEQLYSENGSTSKQGNANPQGNANSPGNENPQGGGSNGKARESGGNSSASSDSNKEEEVERQERATGQLDLTKPLGQKLDNILVLIGSKIKVKYKDGEKSTVVAPLFPNDPDAMREYLPQLMDRAATGGEKTFNGRVNVNLAPAAVLASVPGVDAALAENIVGRRPADPVSADTHQHHPTWLLIDGLVPLEKMKTLLPYLTAGGSVYKVQSVGFFDKGGPIVRLEAVVDASESPPRMLSLKNLTPLGPGFNPQELGAEE